MADDPITLQVRALEGLGLEALRQEWRARYGQAPKLRSPDLLARLLSWRIQADAWGGLNADLLKRLRQKSVPVTGPKLTPGMRLERECGACSTRSTSSTAGSPGMARPTRA